MSEEKTAARPKKGKRDKDRQYPTWKDPYSLDEVDKAIIKLIIEYPAIKKKDIAVKFNISDKHLCARFKKPAMIKAFDDIFAKTLDLLERNNNIAFRRLARLINDPDPWVALRAIEIQLKPFLNQGKIEIKQVQEIIYRARFGDDGAIITDKKEVENTTPKNTLELIAGGKS